MNSATHSSKVSVLTLLCTKHCLSDKVPAASAMEAPFDTVHMLGGLVALICSVDWIRHLDLYMCSYIDSITSHYTSEQQAHVYSFRV
jgi:hypothetical protein